MLSPEQIRSAADTIWQHWQAGTVLAELPEPCRPSSRPEAYAIQSVLASRSQAGLVGWKIAATSKAGQAHIGVDGPLAGRLIRERTHADGAAVSLAGTRMLVAEPEFAFRAGRDLPPRRMAYTADEVLAAMDALIPAIEAPDSRFEDFARVGAAQLIADNACAHEVVLGAPAAAGWRAVDLARHPVKAAAATCSAIRALRSFGW